MHNPALPRLDAGLLAGVTAWRLLVAAFGFIGFGAAVATMNDPWPALSQQASLLTGVVYLVLAAGYVLYGIAKVRRA